MTPTSPVTLSREVERLIELRRKVAALPEPTYPILAVRIVDVDDLIADAIQAARAVTETPEGLDRDVLSEAMLREGFAGWFGGYETAREMADVIGATYDELVRTRLHKEEHGG